MNKSACPLCWDKIGCTCDPKEVAAYVEAQKKTVFEPFVFEESISTPHVIKGDVILIMHEEIEYQWFVTKVVNGVAFITSLEEKPFFEGAEFELKDKVYHRLYNQCSDVRM